MVCVAGISRSAGAGLPLQQRVSAHRSGVYSWSVFLRIADLTSAWCAECRVNVSVGPKENRMLITGLHTVADIFCTVCDANLGWKYEMAYEEGQKYKVRHQAA
eukprot:GHRQ01029587.1.p1 GENE.GHRQ01029587.1~~GHRQ01029587.1.p1  ORF type:complete len:103 (-),score=10.62 GHRQ01029587.1:170-478(-)